MKGFHMRIVAIVFGVLVIGFGVIPRCDDIRITKKWLQEHTSEFKKKDITYYIALAEASNIDLPIHPPTNNLVNPETESVVGPKIFYEEVRVFHFGDKVHKKGKKKGKLVLDKDGNTKPKQKIPFGISFGRPVYEIYEWMKSNYTRKDYICEPYFIQGYRPFHNQISKYITNFGRGVSKPFRGTEGGHALGRSGDVHRACYDYPHWIPLGKVDGETVWYGTEPKKRRGTKGIKPSEEDKPLVIKWIKEVRFKDELEQVQRDIEAYNQKVRSEGNPEKAKGYNEDKCVEYAYKIVIRGLISSNLEGVNNVIFEVAKRNGLTGAACTKAMPLDAGHYGEVESVFFGDEELNVSQERRLERVKIYRDCERNSEKWNSYYEKSLTKGKFNLPLLTHKQCTN